MANISSFLFHLPIAPELIASRSRLSVEQIHQLLGGRDVTSAELRALSQGLGIPLRTFARGAPVEPTLPAIRFRNTQPIDAFDPTNQYFQGFMEVASKLLPHRPFPPDEISVFWQEKHETLQDAELVAISLRSSLYEKRETEPAIGLPQRLNAIDGIILCQLPRSKFEGASLSFKNYVFIFVSPRFPGRMLFTLAHELGHIVAHHSADAWHCDTSGDIGRFRRAEEGFADAFASAFLLPAAGVGGVLSTVRRRLTIKADEIGDIEILYLSRFFGVSFEVAARRCEFLGLLPPGGAYSLTDRLRKDFKSPEQRADQLGVPAHQAAHIDKISPAILRAASAQIADGSLSPTWLAERLRTSIEQLQQANAELREFKTGAH